MSPKWKRAEFTRDEGGLALGGFDPVSYFRGTAPVRGTQEHEVTWSGARWRFASEENREAFLASPEAFAPQCGGLCAFAVSFSDNAWAPPAPPGRPDLWTLADGKLFLNNNRFAHLMFRLFRRASRALAVWNKHAA